MIRRNKIYKTAAVTLAIISVFGSNLQYIQGYGGNDKSSSITQYVDGLYELNTTLKHESKDENSMANGYLLKSEVEIKNSKMYMILVFKSGNMIKEVNPTVNGKSVESTNTLDGDNRIIKFEIQSIDSDITLNVKINPFGNMVVNANCIVKAEFKQTPDVKPETTPEVKPEESPEVKPETTPEDSSTGYKNGYYTLKNTVKIDNETGYAMVRNLLNEVTTMEVKDSKTYITFEMSGSSMMSDIQIKVDGKIVKHEQTSIGNDTLRFKIEVPSIDSNITMSMYVNAMGRNTEFGIVLNKSSIVFVNSNEEPTIPSTNAGVNIGSSNETTENSSSSVEKVETVAAKGKLYTIKNEVVHDNQTGKEMARKYLNSTTKIEEIDGKYYATLTFTGSSLMNNHKIYVNGSKVSHQIVAKGSDSVSLRVAIPSLDANIKVALHVIPMGRDIDFGVKLLKDTLTFVKEFDTTSYTLPQTGSLLNNQIVMMSGSLLVTSGLLSRRNKRK